MRIVTHKIALDKNHCTSSV